MSHTILVNAGPWLPVPPGGYGGIENVLATLIPQLRSAGHRVVLACVGSSRLPVDERIVIYDEPRFEHIAEPYNRVVGIAAAHQSGLVAAVRDRDDIDLVHDHLEALGPSLLVAAGRQIPPVLHTLHWDLTKHRELYRSLDGRGRFFVNGVSADQIAHAPAALRAHSLGHVYLATPLADTAPPPPAKADHVVMLARICPLKGQDTAARIAHRTRTPLVLAGPVGPYRDAPALDEGLRNGRTGHPDVRYWTERVAPLVDGDLVRWVGTVDSPVRERLVATARATLCPLSWDEPGGTSIVESLALGTPVLGFRRGCLPELLDGRTGLLAEPGDEDGLAGLLRQLDRLDPDACQQTARARFSPARMAEEYLRLYDEVLSRAGDPVLEMPRAV